MQIPEKLFGYRYREIKHPAKARLRTFWCADLPLPPASFDADATMPNGIVLPARIYDNDVEGDCVIAARANQQTRFSTKFLGTLLNVSDDAVEAEYLNETGGQDTGLVPDDSLDLWRTNGWYPDGKFHMISAWGRVDATDMIDVQRCISLLMGMQLSVMLPLAWRDALNAGQPWDAPTQEQQSDPRWQLGSWGGHQVYVPKYDAIGVYPWTWGQQQLITWAGLAWAGAVDNQGEAEGIVAGKMDVLDVAGLNQDLDLIAEN